MSVKRPGSALSSGAEPLEPLDSKEILQKSVKGGDFASQLEALESAAAGETSLAQESPTLQGLRSIAANPNLSGEAAVRESARFMVNSRISEKYRDNEKVSAMIEELTDFVASDPFLGKKLEKILQQLKEQ